MIDRGQHNILGVLINAVDYESAVDKIVTAAKSKSALGVSALAVHGVMTGALDRQHRYRLNRLGLIVPDGQPVRWALNRLHGTELPDRVYGPTLMLKTCERAAQEGLTVFLLGADIEMLDNLRKALLEKFPDLKIAGYRPSKFRQLDQSEKREMMKEIRESRAEILFVGLGCPRQEIFCYECCEELEMPALAVGAAFAFHAGCLPQAPSWMQRYGLEWLFRFIQEPKRLWKRYMYLNPLYVTLIGLQMLKLRCPDADDTDKPTVECLYGQYFGAVVCSRSLSAARVCILGVLARKRRTNGGLIDATVLVAFRVFVLIRTSYAENATSLLATANDRIKKYRKGDVTLQLDRMVRHCLTGPKSSST